MTQFLQIIEVHQQQKDSWLSMIWLADHLGQRYNPNPKTSKLTPLIAEKQIAKKALLVHWIPVVSPYFKFVW